MTSLYRLSQGCIFRLFFCPSLTLVSSVWELEGWANCQPQTWHRDSSPPINALFPSLSSSRQAHSKVFCQSERAAKAEPRLNIAGVSWRSGSKKKKKKFKKRYRDGASWKMAPERPRAKASLWQVGIECGAVGQEGGRTLRRCIKVRGRHLCDALRGRMVMKRDNASKQSGADEQMMMDERQRELAPHGPPCLPCLRGPTLAAQLAR